MNPTDQPRAYDRLLEKAGEQMATISPRPDLERAARDADVPLDQAHAMFADNDALATMVLQQQMMLLTDSLTQRAVAAPAGDVIAQFRALAHAYLDWFFDNRGAGRLLLNPAAMAAASKSDVSRYSASIYELGRSMMERAQAGGLIRADVDIPSVMLTMRALVLGIVLLQDMDHARHWGDLSDPRQALRGVLDSYFDMVTGAGAIGDGDVTG